MLDLKLEAKSNLISYLCKTLDIWYFFDYLHTAWDVSITENVVDMKEDIRKIPGTTWNYLAMFSLCN